MPRRTRLDAELVRRGLARSREHASQLIADGRVTVRGTVAGKPATAVETDAAVVVRDLGNDPDWASRGAHKLVGALEKFAVGVDGRRCLDAGASTGGFTDVLLRRARGEVVAADVGRGQLVWRLQTDDRVVGARQDQRPRPHPEDRPAARSTWSSPTCPSSPCASCCPRCSRARADDADLLPMVKPQFEVGKERLGSGGVVRDPALRAEAVLDVLKRPGSWVCGPAAWSPARFPVRPAMSNTSLGCAAATPAATTSGGRARGDRRRGRAPMTAREVLLVVHTGRAGHPSRRGRSRDRSPTPISGCGCWTTRRRTWTRPATSGSCRSTPTAAEGTELVLVLGGDGTLLRAAELARPAGVPVLGGEPGPCRVSRRGRLRHARRGGVAGHRAAIRGRDRMTSTSRRR